MSSAKTVALIGAITITMAVGISAVAMITSVRRYADYWSTNNTTPITKGDFVIVVIGDSSVQGVGATSAMKGFVGQLSKRISRQLNRPVRIINYSVSGAVAAEVLSDQLSNTDSFKRADLVVMSIGANDIGRGVEKDDFLRDYSAILDRLPASKTVVASIPPLARNGIADSIVEERNDGLKEAASLRGIKVAPFTPRDRWKEGPSERNF